MSERKLQANRANANCSTGPKSQAGKAASRRNSLKHGILGRSVDLPSSSSELDLRLPIFKARLMSDIVGADSARQEIGHLFGKLARVLAFENRCFQEPADFERNAQLICRYERMLTKQLHARIRVYADLEGKNLKN
jgi:hypothetical protein